MNATQQEGFEKTVAIKAYAQRILDYCPSTVTNVSVLEALRHDLLRMMVLLTELEKK